MDMADVQSLGPRPADRAGDRAIGRSPAHHDELAAFLPLLHLLVGYLDPEPLVAADVGHRLVVAGRIIDVAGAQRLLDPADAVEQPRRARLDPGALELRVA